MNFNERLKKIRKYYGDIQEETAEKCKITTATYNRYEKGNRSGDVSFIKAFLSAYPRVNSNWLLKGEGEMLLNKAESPEEAAYAPNSQSGTLERVAAKLFELIKKEEHHKQTSTPAFKEDLAESPAKQLASLEQKSTPSFKECRTIRLNTNALTPIALKGHTLFYSETEALHEGDLVYAKLKEGTPFFKRYSKSKEKNIILLSVNPAEHLPPVIIKENELTFMYKIIGVAF